MNILVIEDDPSIQETLRDILEVNGHAVTVAGTGAEGLARAAGRPEFILCDIGLPDIEGYDVIAAIRQMPECRDVPFVFLTARAARSEQRRGMALGADDYITKPFTEREILDAIAARVQRQRPLRERVDELMDLHRREASAQWSHELLTPLNAVLGGLALLESEADTVERDELKELVGIIRSGAERQYQLARKIILFFDLEQLRRADTKDPVVVCRGRADAAAAAGAVRAGGEERRASDVVVHCDPGSVALNEEYLAHAVAELVGNGLRFSAPGRTVEVRGFVRGDRYRVEVADQGIGMTAEERARVAPFTQFGRAEREQQGLGLGLAIARDTMEMAGGTFALEAGPGGIGLRAVLELPLQGETRAAIAS